MATPLFAFESDFDARALTFDDFTASNSRDHQRFDIRKHESSRGGLTGDYPCKAFLNRDFRVMIAFFSVIRKGAC